MGLLQCSLIFIPLILALAFFAGRQDRGWLVLGSRTLVLAGIAALLLVVGVLSLPTYPLLEDFENPFPGPSGVLYAGMIYLLPFLALILATILLYNGLARIKPRRPSGSTGEEGRKPASGRTGWMAFASLMLSGLLYGAAFYNLYWQFLWDRTTDSWDIFLLLAPFATVLVSSVLLAGSLRGRHKWVGFLYTVLLVAIVIAIFTQAKQVDYHQLTESHAEQVSQAIERYYAREGRYPENLHQLVPWTTLSLPKPVIMIGQEWCYQSGDGSYRLGYVTRDHWSIPYLEVQVYKSAGTGPAQPELCEAEVEALIARDPIFSVIR